jgi:hypothetical protein
MESKIIKSKRTSDGTVDLFEFHDYFNVITGYSVVKAFIKNDVVGPGATKIEKMNFLNKDEAIIFFNNQN